MACTAVVLGATALALAACGRAGWLETPPAPAVSPTASVAPNGTVQPGSPDANSAAAQANDKSQKTGFDASGNAVAAPGQQKSFPLDFLLR